MDSSTSRAETPLPIQQLSWGPLVLTEEKIDVLWEKVQEFPQAFDDFSVGNKKGFVAQLLNPQNIFVDIGDGVGLAAGFNVRPKLDMVLHLLMFDRRLKGREALFLEIIAFYMIRLQLRRVTAMSTEDLTMTHRLLERMGFTREGNMRRAILRGGKYLDLYIYGLLSEELHVVEDKALEVRGSGADDPADSEVSTERSGQLRLLAD